MAVKSTRERLRVVRRPRPVPDPPWAHFRVATSCPPDTALHIRGGYAYSGPAWDTPGQGRRYEGASLDLADTDYGLDYTFDTAYHYLGVLVCADFAAEWATGDWGFVIYPDASEYATAAEVEDSLQTAFAGVEIWNGHRPLALLVLRNDGNTTDPNQLQHIEPVNRGRSYFWKDARPRGSFGQ